VLYAGLERLGAGAVLAGLMLGAIAVFVINREYSRAIVYTLIAGLLSLIGLIHDPAGLIFANVNGAWQIRTPEPIWIGYVLAAAVIASAAWRERALSMGTMRDAVTTPPEAEPEPSMA
jgi:AGZA family xanthine/uracil permease-like MFS transporter